MGSVLALLSLTVGSLACIHITKAEQWASALPRTGLGFCFFSISSRTFQLLEFSNLSKIVVGGREREKKEYVACVNMCTFVYFSCRNYWISCIMPEKCQNCKKTSKSQLKKFL